MSSKAITWAAKVRNTTATSMPSMSIAASIEVGVVPASRPLASPAAASRTLIFSSIRSDR